MSAPREITLGLGDGEVTVPVYAQSIPYLLNRMSRFGMGLSDAGELLEGGEADAIAFLGGRVYEALVAVIPALAKRMPEHVFCGYVSAEAMTAGDIDEDALRCAPSLPQVREAFRVAAEVNGLDIFSHLKGLVEKLVDPTVLRAKVSVWLAEMGSSSMTSPSSPLQSGASAPSTSGTTSPPSPEIIPSA